MNEDTISRQAVISELNKYVDYSDDGEQEINADIVFITLKEFPSAERRGRWEDVNEDGTLYRCSVCGEMSCCKSLFCGDCGARMGR